MKMVGVALVTMTAGGAIVPAADADSVSFSVGIDGRATVGAWSTRRARTHELRARARRHGHRQGGAGRVGRPALQASDLVAGDVLNVYRGATLLGSAPCAGRPMIRQDACAGRTSFTVVRGRDRDHRPAPARRAHRCGSGDHSRSIWTRTDAFATVRSTARCAWARSRGCRRTPRPGGRTAASRG